MQKQRAISYLVTFILASLSLASLSLAGGYQVACVVNHNQYEAGDGVGCLGCGGTCCTGSLLIVRDMWRCDPGICTPENCGDCSSHELVRQQKAIWFEPADPGGDCPEEGNCEEITEVEFTYFSCHCTWAQENPSQG